MKEMASTPKASLAKEPMADYC
jgi:hypothetical protein